ncbi:MAG: YlcI/YnfO family protein [Thermomonas sp.]|uniref:YlcI/YnfO family protein n=1 Tax=Thermomonas sp. TaxID=1971895 RepID=UPI0039E42733
MKTATLPSLRVEPALREAAESVLREGETLSGFVEAAVRGQVAQRKHQEEFIKRGLASLEYARTHDAYLTPEQSLARLDAILERHEKRRA